MPYVKCKVCKIDVRRRPSRIKRQENVFCSQNCKWDFQRGKPTWNKGKTLQPLSEDHKKKISESVRKNPRVKKSQFKKGHKLWTKELRSKRKKTVQETGCFSGKNNGMYGRVGNLNPNWKGGASYWRKEYYNSIPYKNWQRGVFMRDNYKCQMCGCYKTKGNIVHAHHIKPFATYPKLRLDVGNGVTLCKKCHSFVHSKKFQIGKIVSIERFEERENMIDIEVKDNNNFFANGVLVHNSATPYREDGRTDYIFALTGFPIGLDWKVLLDLGLIKAPDITLYLARDYNQKLNKLGELLNDPVKTLIYSFGLSTGNRLSRKFDIPFVHGGTPVKSRREIINSSLTTVISSAGREGLSIQDLQRTISYNFLFGSRQEETQFFGRLLHGDDKGEHIIMMTDEEYEKYGKRLYGIEEKGFKIRIVRC